MISAATSGSVDTKTKILNSAEKLFGMNGFKGTYLRDITAEAQVNLAAVNYHFQTKESLIDALIERRIEPINRSRFEMLDAAGSSPSVEKIVEAYLLPLLMVDVKTSAPMLGRVLSNPDQFVERVYKRHLSPVVERFSEAIGQALPNLPQEERFWRLQFMAGSMTHLLALSGVMPLMSGQPFDRAAVMARLVPFLAAGLRAPVADPSTKREEL